MNYGLKTLFVSTLGLLLVGGIALFFSSNNVSEENEVVGAVLPLEAKTENAKYWAKVDEQGNVLQVIVADKEFINTLNPSEWVPAYKDASLRKNYPGKGFTYDATEDMFVPPKTDLKATLDLTTGRWKTLDTFDYSFYDPSSTTKDRPPKLPRIFTR